MSLSEPGPEPPRKKRRSKWDIQAPDAAPSQSAMPTSIAPSDAAMAAAAKLNAMLAAQGKLVKSATPPLLPPIQSVTLPSNILASSGTIARSDAGTSDVLGMITAEVEINDLKPEMRVHLTKGPTLSDLNRASGAFVSVRGRYLDIVEKARIPREGRPLYLHVQGSTKEKVDVAVNRIKDIIASPLPLIDHTPTPAPLLPVAPPFIAPAHHPSGGTSHLPGGLHYVQDKVFVGLDQAPESFKVTEKLQGPSGAYLGHIATQTGAKVHLRGRGSGYIEPTSGKESFEALYIYISHSNQDGLTGARKLCESLIDAVQKEFENWNKSQQPLGFGGTAPGYGPSRHPGFGGQPYHHSPYNLPPAHGYGPPPHGYQGQPLPGPPPPPGAPPYSYYPPHPHPPPPPPPPHSGYYGPQGEYGPQGGYGPQGAYGAPPSHYQPPAPYHPPPQGPLPPPPPPPPPPPNGINYGPPVPEQPKRRFKEQSSVSNGNPTSKEELLVEEMVEHHHEEKSERESEQRGTETNAESQENKVDTETKEEHQEMKSEPDSGTRPGKPVQSGAHTMPPPSDSIQLMLPPSRAPPSNASSGQLMPPPSRAPPGNASSGQLMPPPPLPSRLKVPNQPAKVATAIQPTDPQASNTPTEELNTKCPKTNNVPTVVNAIHPQPAVSRVRQNPLSLVAYGDDSSDSETDT